jgi:hypothetical protein
MVYFVNFFSLSRLVKTAIAYLFLVWEYLRRTVGPAKIWFFCFCFYTAVFSSTAAPKNILISLKWWDSQPLQTITFQLFKYSAQKPRYERLNFLKNIPTNLFVFWPCGSESRQKKIPNSVNKRNQSTNDFAVYLSDNNNFSSFIFKFTCNIIFSCFVSAANLTSLLKPPHFLRGKKPNFSVSPDTELKPRK